MTRSRLIGAFLEVTEPVVGLGQLVCGDWTTSREVGVVIPVVCTRLEISSSLWLDFSPLPPVLRVGPGVIFEK